MNQILKSLMTDDDKKVFLQIYLETLQKSLDENSKEFLDSLPTQTAERIKEAYKSAAEASLKHWNEVILDEKFKAGEP